MQQISQKKVNAPTNCSALRLPTPRAHNRFPASGVRFSDNTDAGNENNAAEMEVVTPVAFNRVFLTAGAYFLGRCNPGAIRAKLVQRFHSPIFRRFLYGHHDKPQTKIAGGRRKSG